MRSVSADDDHTVLFELSEPHATFATDLEMPVLRAGRRAACASARPLAGGVRALSVTKPREERPLAGAQFPLPRLMCAPDPTCASWWYATTTRALCACSPLAGDLAHKRLAAPALAAVRGAPRPARLEHGSGRRHHATSASTSTHPRLCDLRVRTALAHAIDRQRLVTLQARRARHACEQLDPGRALGPRRRHAQLRLRSRARRALCCGEAGLERGQSLRLARMRTSSDRAVVSLARAMASMLADVGFELEVRPSETATLLARSRPRALRAEPAAGPRGLRAQRAQLVLRERSYPGARRARGWKPLSPARCQSSTGCFLRADRSWSARGAWRSTAEVQHLLAHELPVIPLWHEDVVAVVSRRMFSYQVPRDARFGTLAAWGAR